MATDGTSKSSVNLFNGTLVVATDPFGADLKDAVVAQLKTIDGLMITDLGTESYFKAAERVARAVQDGKRNAGDLSQPETVRGLLFCGSGMGVSIIANKFEGIAAAVVENEHAARCSRAINDSNILCLGGKVTPIQQALEIVGAWLEQGFAKAPCRNGEMGPEWWSNEVEGFLNNKWPEVHEIESASRKKIENL